VARNPVLAQRPHAIVAALLAVLAAPPATWAADPAPFEMETFQLVLLVRDPAAKKLPAEEARALQAAHLAHLTRMGETGKAVVCGPFGKQLDATLRGACIYARTRSSRPASSASRP
jgi:uncharacterized protein YciI